MSNCVENLTRQRHDRDQTENQLSTVAAVDSRFGLYHVAVVLSLIFYAVSALHWVTLI